MRARFYSADLHHTITISNVLNSYENSINNIKHHLQKKVIFKNDIQTYLTTLNAAKKFIKDFSKHIPPHISKSLNNQIEELLSKINVFFNLFKKNQETKENLSIVAKAPKINSIDHLSNDLLITIFEFLEFKELTNASFVSKLWLNLINTLPLNTNEITTLDNNLIIELHDLKLNMTHGQLNQQITHSLNKGLNKYAFWKLKKDKLNETIGKLSNEYAKNNNTRK